MSRLKKIQNELEEKQRLFKKSLDDYKAALKAEIKQELKAELADDLKALGIKKEYPYIENKEGERIKLPE